MTMAAGAIAFWCPGCKTLHAIHVAPRPDGRLGPQWGYNDNPERPTFTPSILVTWTYGEERASKVWYENRAGQIQFLGDCTHALAGQTVEIPDYP
jgi:hypothetical protein